ncbi:quinolinate synthetase A [Nitrosococcus oceani ATCC 19707]|uniref:Quinolinate synthase n=2 Tax=Nitrosococcus oceani TaxID=1229 RepID=Q3JEB5_NITOC|nr:quinolinate synthase NadA [Nitrosococcus oceani]ABA56831.1 quinolinate synthetase A [Nitrosococcus oceani ATCC 19707]EDZ65460.1 quinolinate synthetase complex, A subunit [Nitrosococcus oceani AFC27]KFI20785.1 quinolinate synthetase [Nitrosococcus oceani C-27]GEM20589.1 quinolinate synthetase [Nitrosococcus oceani]
MAEAAVIQSYIDLRDSECEARVAKAKAALGAQVVILGHHYQREEVFRFTDYAGDSLKLSRQAAVSEAKYIVFCGVHFMAEVADILSRPEQIAILPDMAAGCAMADMADLAKVERAWRELGQILEPEEKVTPVTYINSAANLKAFCGRHGGIVCTSSNAEAVLNWAFERREKVLFFPDQHLGRNTAYRMGIPLEKMAVWNFNRPNGGLTQEQIQEARIILWQGFCSVHQMFQPEHIDRFLARYPDAKVISHPENSFEVCQKSHYVGSTEYIIKTIREAESGTRWLVGTELNLVNRLHERYKNEGKSIHFMSPTVCMCSTMFRIDPQHLAWSLENLLSGQVVNQIKVPEDEAELARLALSRMLEVSP